MSWKKLDDRFNQACETLILALAKHYGIINRFELTVPKTSDEVAEVIGFKKDLVRKICILLEKIGILERAATGMGFILTDMGALLTKPADLFSENFDDALPIFYEQLMLYVEALTHAKETLGSGMPPKEFMESEMLNVSPHLNAPIGNLLAEQIDGLVKSGDRVIVLGYGSSILGYLIAKRITTRGNVTCLDIFEPLREDTAKRAEEQDLQSIIDFDTIDLLGKVKSNSFDICIIAGIHRFLQPEEAVGLYADAKRILHDKGILVVVEICVDSAGESAVQVMNALTTPSTTFHPSREEVKANLKASGFEFKNLKDFPEQSDTKISIFISRNKK